MAEPLSNWAGNYTYSAARRHAPASVEQLQAVVRQAEKVKVLGTRHSFNGIADTTGDLIALDRLPRTVAVDQARQRVTVDGGAVYGELCEALHASGLALANLASLPNISVAGAVASATHGSGVANGNLATAVAAMEIITADGERIMVSRDNPAAQFDGLVVHLGGLGVVSQLTLDVVPTYEMRQDVYERLPVAHLEQHFDEIVARAYSVSLFTDWQAPVITQVWLKRQVSAGVEDELPAEWFDAVLAREQQHPMSQMVAANCTEQLGVPGPWHDRLPHFRRDSTPSSGHELQSEYFVAREDAVAAIGVIHELSAQLAPVLQISEVRTIAADALWLSPCYGRASVGIHFTWKKDVAGVQKVLPQLEAALAPFGARPHWAKLFTLPPSTLQALYPRLPEFQRLLRDYDPRGKFRNAFLDTYVFGA